MHFGGFQKLTLLDFPGVVSCTLFTKGCNFLCPFCHNAPLVSKPHEAADISSAEILSFLKKRQGVLEGVCVTGGEPLLHAELPDFLREVKALGYKIKLDTNGSFPDRLRALAEEGLIDYVAMDIKNTREKYRETADCPSLDIRKIEESVSFLLSGRVDYEFRTTVVRELHALQDIDEIGRWIAGAERYFLQGFVDSGNLIAEGFSAYSPETMAKMREKAAVYVKNAEIRGIS